MKMTNSTPPTPDTETGGSFLAHLWASVAATIILTVICCGVYPLIVWGVAQAVFSNKANGSLIAKDGTATNDDKLAVGSSLLGQNFSLAGYFHPRPSAAGAGYDATSSGGSNLGPLSDKLINGATNAAVTTVTPQTPTTQPESVALDGIRLRTIHYAVDNSIPFKLYHAVYLKDGDSYKLDRKDVVQPSTYLDASGSLTMTDVALIDAFPHPISSEDFTRTVLIADDFGTPIPADAVTASGSGLDPHITPENAELQKARVATARNIKPEQVEELITAHTDGRALGILGDPGVNVLMLNLALDAKYPLPASPATQPAAAATTQPVVK